MDVLGTARLLYSIAKSLWLGNFHVSAILGCLLITIWLLGFIKVCIRRRDRYWDNLKATSISVIVYKVKCVFLWRLTCHYLIRTILITFISQIVRILLNELILVGINPVNVLNMVHARSIRKMIILFELCVGIRWNRAAAFFVILKHVQLRLDVRCVDGTISLIKFGSSLRLSLIEEVIGIKRPIIVLSIM